MEETSEKKLAIENVTFEVELTDKDAQVWITTSINNMTDGSLRADLTLVLEKDFDREEIEIVEYIEPAITEVESVIRIRNLEDWEQDRIYTLMVGLRCEGEVQAVAQREVAVK